MLANMKKYIAEFIGTFVLVALACGVAAVVGCNDAAGKIATSLAFGLVIVAMSYSIGHISGCHINPAVSVAMFLSRKLSLKDLLGYVVAQIVGGFLGAMAVALFAGGWDIGGCVNGIAGIQEQWNFDYDVSAMFIALAIEVILTFIFVFAIFGATYKKEHSSLSGLIIGGALTLVHLIGTSLTGTSVNPARSIGPAIVYAFSGDPSGLITIWIFIVGPLVGAVLAAIVWRLLTFNKEMAE